MKKTGFELVWPNPPRSTTRAEWKAASRWLRICRREVDKHIDYAKLHNAVVNTMIYGTNCMRIE